jgi:hypothetical protein
MLSGATENRSPFALFTGASQVAPVSSKPFRPLHWGESGSITGFLS